MSFASRPRVSAGPEQAAGSGPAEQGGRVGEARGRRLQAAGAAGRVRRHGRIPGHLQPEAGNHRPHRPEDPQRAVGYRNNPLERTCITCRLMILPPVCIYFYLVGHLLVLLEYGKGPPLNIISPVLNIIAPVLNHPFNIIARGLENGSKPDN